MTYIAVLFRRSARHWLRLGLGRGEAGGEDRNVCSIWNRSHGMRKPSGKHPLDGETFLNKNKEQRTKNKEQRTSPLQLPQCPQHHICVLATLSLTMVHRTHELSNTPLHHTQKIWNQLIDTTLQLLHTTTRCPYLIVLSCL